MKIKTAWKITRSTDNQKASMGNQELLNDSTLDKYKFRLLDDDGNWCASGVIVTNYNGEELFNPIDYFGEPEYGATETWLKKEGEKEYELL